MVTSSKPVSGELSRKGKRQSAKGKSEEGKGKQLRFSRRSPDLCLSSFCLLRFAFCLFPMLVKYLTSNKPVSGELLEKAKGKAQRAKVNKAKGSNCASPVESGPFAFHPFAFCALPFAFSFSPLDQFPLFGSEPRNSPITKSPNHSIPISPPPGRWCRGRGARRCARARPGARRI